MTEPSERPFITIISGAGASLSGGGPSTRQLSTAVERLPISARIVQAIRNHCNCDDPLNFEDVLYVLEDLETSLDPTDHSRTTRDIKPFLDWSPILKDIPKDWRLFRKERFDVAELLHNQLAGITGDGRQALYRWLRPLAERYEFRWFTLNYDLISDETINALSKDLDRPWYDGFDPTTLLFRPDQYPQAEELFGPIRLWLSHLHGSLLFGYRDMAPYFAHGPPLEIIRMSSAENALQNWRGFHKAFIDNDDDDFWIGTLISPIVSGLRKTEKLNSQPYGNYLQAFASSLLGSPYLLLIGYGGSDPHINYWIDQCFRTHNARMRVIEVTRGTRPQDSVTSNLTRFQLANPWKQIEDGIYVSLIGVPAMVILTGVADAEPPTTFMLEQLEGKYADARFTSLL